MSNNREHRVGTWKASAYGLHPSAFFMLVPTIFLTIVWTYKIFLIYLSVIVVQIVLKYKVKRDAKTVVRSIVNALFGSTKLTIRN